MKNRFTPLLAGSLMSAALFCSAAAQADTFLKIEDPKGVGEVKGDAFLEGYEGQLSITSFSESLMASEGSSAADVQFQFTWRTDAEPVSPKLYEALLSGKRVSKMVFTFVMPNQPHGGMVRRKEVVLEDVALLQQVGEQEPHQSTTATFSVQPHKVTWTVWDRDKDGKAVSPKSTTWVRPAADPS